MDNEQEIRAEMDATGFPYDQARDIVRQRHQERPGASAMSRIGDKDQMALFQARKQRQAQRQVPPPPNWTMPPSANGHAPNSPDLATNAGDLSVWKRAEPVSPQPRAPAESSAACPRCRGAHFLVTDAPIGHPDFGKLVACDCLRTEQAAQARVVHEARSQRILAELRRQLGKLATCAFTDFDTEVADPVQRQSLRQALVLCETYADAPAGWLYLAGSYGVGKSHLAAAIARQAAERGQQVAYASTPRLLAYLAQGFRDREHSTEDRFQALVDAELVILDDIGTEHPNPWTTSQLFDLINQRYLYDAPTVFTSNLAPSELDGRLTSRINGLARVVTVDAPDYRCRR